MSQTSPVWEHLSRIGLTHPHPTALYFADPMCSWCWGFAPVIADLADRYRDTLHVQCVMGGLRAGNTVPTNQAFREEILHHWRAVQARTGAPFAFDGALADGFVYDTEPACRAVVAVARRESAKTLGVLRALQRAFYAERQDVTRSEVLTVIAGQQGLDADDFLAAFNLPEARDQTQAHFRFARDFGVRGFPTVILVDTHAASLLTSGYTPLEALVPRLEAWLGRLQDTHAHGA